MLKLWVRAVGLPGLSGGFIKGGGLISIFREFFAGWGCQIFHFGGALRAGVPGVLGLLCVCVCVGMRRLWQLVRQQVYIPCV